MRSSEIRDLMSLAASPDIISFSGGMPGNELFPLEMIDQIYQSLSEKEKQVPCSMGLPMDSGTAGIACTILRRGCRSGRTGC